MFPVISEKEVAKLCFAKYKSLPKTGKPCNNEWTVLAGIILHNRQTGKSLVISLGCGTKCIGKSKLCPKGLIVNDSHAEILARRGLLRYLYHEIRKAAVDKQSIFSWVAQTKKFQLKDELSLHFFSTQTPCGDACIKVVKEVEEKDEYVKEPINKRSKVSDIQFEDTDVGNLIATVYTGAKLIDSNRNDAMEQIAGPVRTKPGRGERTLSMSCSDKLAKWQIMGVQGALLDFLLTKPIYFDTLNFWGENNMASLERAVWKRFKNNEIIHNKYNLHTPKIRVLNKSDFPDAKDSVKKPSPNGIVWSDVPHTIKPFEICVNGKRQGITTKKMETPESALKISKYFLFQEFINIIKVKPELLSTETLEAKTYWDCKFLATDYQSAWNDVKMKYFKEWSQKPVDNLKFYVKMQ